MNQLDWEFPASADKAHYTALLKELRAQLDAQGVTDNRHYFLTAALPQDPRTTGTSNSIKFTSISTG